MQKEGLKQNDSGVEEKNLAGLPLPIEEWLIKKQMRDYLDYINRGIEICIILLSGAFVLGIIALVHFW